MLTSSDLASLEESTPPTLPVLSMGVQLHVLGAGECRCVVVVHVCKLNDNKLIILAY